MWMFTEVKTGEVMVLGSRRMQLDGVAVINDEVICGCGKADAEGREECHKGRFDNHTVVLQRFGGYQDQNYSQ